MSESDKVFTCACTHHIFRVTDFGDGEVWLGWYTQPGPSSLRWRIRNAWRCLLSREEWAAADMVMSRDDAWRLGHTLCQSAELMEVDL